MLSFLLGSLTVILDILSVIAALSVFLLVLPFIPGAIDSLANRPNRYGAGRQLPYAKSRFGFFTFLQPGRVKIIQRGEKFVRAIMDFDEHMFAGENANNPYTPAHYQYWEVLRSGAHDDSDPLPFPYPGARDTWPRYALVGILWWRWKRMVYKSTGAVFTGIWPFQTVRVYPMERFKKITEKNGTVDLERHEDYSDHYRVADFQYPVRIPEADTRDKIAVRVLLNVIARATNPYLVAYYTDDDWPTRYSAAVTTRVTSFTRPRPLDNVLSARDGREAEALGRYITAGRQTIRFGIKTILSQVLDISPTDPNIDAKLGDVAIAKVDRDAAKERAIGQAAYVREQGEAMRAYPDGGTAVVQAEALVRAARAAGEGGGTVILGGGSVDPMQAAILQELKRR